MLRGRAGAVEHGRKGQRELLAWEMMVTQKEKMGIEERWGAREEDASKDGMLLCAFIPLEQKPAVPYQYHGNSMEPLRGPSNALKQSCLSCTCSRYWDCLLLKTVGKLTGKWKHGDQLSWSQSDQLSAWKSMYLSGLSWHLMGQVGEQTCLRTLS